MTDITLPPMPQGVPYQESVLVAYARAAMKLNAPQWQPIETAPKDGRPVLGIHHGSSRAFEMYRGPHGWWLDTKDRRRDPSYWMPMPSPPDHFRDVVSAEPLTHRCPNCDAVYQGHGCPRCRLAAAVEVQSEPVSAADDHAQLRDFYDVQTDSDLIVAQQRHIEKLQAKLPRKSDTMPGRLRAG